MTTRSETAAAGGAFEGRRAQGWRSRASRYGPLLLWAALICYASTGAMSADHTSRFIGPLLRWLFPAIDEGQLRAAHMTVRKLAHFAEYAILALLAARAFLTSSKVFLRARWAAAAFGLAACLALLDELNQSFIPSRGGSIWDSLLDATGAASALALCALIRARTQRRRVSVR